MNIKSAFKNIYYNNTPLTKKDMFNSRTISIFEGCSARTIFTLTGGAFISGYAKYLGANDQITGIIARFPYWLEL